MESLRTLRQLVTLAEVGRYRKASEKLGITHSALSQAVKRVEDFYGVPVFRRRDGRIAPTDYGQILIETARTTLANFDAFKRQIGEIQSFEAGQLSIGADPHLANGLVAPALGHLTAQFPKLHFTVHTCLWHEIRDRLHDDSIDIYVGLPPDDPISDVKMEEFLVPPPVTACRADHPLTHVDRPSVRDVLNYPIASGAAPDWVMKQIQALFGPNAPTIWELKDLFLLTYDLSVLPTIIVNSDAIGLLPYRTIRSDLKAGRAVALTFSELPDPAPIRGVIGTRDNTLLSPIAQAFRAELYREMRQVPPALENSR